ncbi:MAG TPA: alkaline phosphatase family protein [Candidatus Binatus sp.]|nr:alkaline phosphatase family protein [Candidatus Binatus sp.]
MIAPPAPAYGRGSLADLLPSMLAAIGRPGVAAAEPRIPLPSRPWICLLLVDGLGSDLLAEHAARHAPFLAELLATGLTLDAGFPSSTPVSLCSLGTGTPPGQHGVLGFTMRVPPDPAVIECLTWRRYGAAESLAEDLPPERVQSIEPLAGNARRDGIEMTVVSLREHVGSALSRAAFRGARFDPIDRFEDWRSRDAAVRRGLAFDGAIVYTYDARLDTAAHVHGPGSAVWRSSLEATDRLARRLADSLPRDAMLLVTGDHGGTLVRATERRDLAERPELAAGVEALSGEPRARHVHATPGRGAEVLRAWRDSLGDDWLVLSRSEAIEAGLFGPSVAEAVRPRIGDVVATTMLGGGIYDSRQYPWELRLLGLHGGLSRGELRVPLLIATG